MSLARHLYEWSLDELSPVFEDAGITLLDDARALSHEDLEELGCSAAQAISLRASFGYGGEHGALLAGTMAEVSAQVRAMRQESEEGDGDEGEDAAGSDEAMALKMRSTELGRHLERWNMLGWAAPLLAESGIELCSDLEHLEFGAGSHTPACQSPPAPQAHTEAACSRGPPQPRTVAITTLSSHALGGRTWRTWASVSSRHRLHSYYRRQAQLERDAEDPLTPQS